MMQAGFELFDHTADMGIRAWGPSLDQLFQAAAQGMYGVIGELEPGDAEKVLPLDLSGSDRAELLRRFLAELLLIFERDHLFVTEYRKMDVTDHRMLAELGLAAVDWDRSVLSREVKAVTYHELAVDRTDAGYEARVIVDI